MSLIGSFLEEEKNYLNLVKKIVDQKIDGLKEDNKEVSQSITSEQKNKWESISDMDISEIEFANSQIERTLIQAKLYYQQLRKFEKIYQSPYFGRVDFEEKDKKTKVYIGLSSVSDSSYNNYVFDWRAPISSLYYDYELGKASYTAPEGIVEGAIDLKRQYKIQHSELQYAFDSSLNIQDEMLQEALSHNSSEKMKDIVTTIQKEQNKVIRNIEYDNLIVEGAAGSGKTSVAMHRIAFILYRYREFVSNKNIIIFSPNRVFSDYISDVLPSLGEENVLCLLFSEFLEHQIREYEDVENYYLLIERYHNTKEKQEKKVAEIKMSNEFIEIVDKYIAKVISQISFDDIIVNDEILLTKAECEVDFNKTYARYNPLVRVEKIINNVSTRYRNTHLKKTPGYMQKIKSAIKYIDDIKLLMENMYRDKEFLQAVHKKYNIDTEVFKSFCLKELSDVCLKYYDGIIYLYLKARLSSLIPRNDIKYIVVDEAQDYNLMQYFLIKEVFKNAKFTILGDPNQAITSMINYTDMGSIKDIIGGKSELLKLLTTYRSSYEITKFCNSILALNNVNMINRHSKEPQIIDSNKEELSNQIVNLITESVKEGLESVAVLCKDKDIEYEIKQLLENKEFKIKLYVLPIYSSKGLEFDSVIVYDNGFSKTDKKLYYVACTRALHKLNILKLKS